MRLVSFVVFVLFAILAFSPVMIAPVSLEISPVARDAGNAVASQGSPPLPSPSPSPTPPGRPQSGRLGTSLKDLVEADVQGRRAEVVQRRRLRLDGDLVRVTVTARADRAPAARRAVEATGGRVIGGRYVYDTDEVIAAWVPITALASLAEHETVESVVQPAEAEPPEQPMARQPFEVPVGQSRDSQDEFRALIGGETWHAAGYRGQDVKIGVIDQGFGGWRGYEQTFFANKECNDDELFGPIDDEESQSGEPHGTAVARTLAEIAPEAKFYLAKSVNPDTLFPTVRCMQEKGVEIINFSKSYFYNIDEGPGDDTGVANRIVDWVSAQFGRVGPYAAGHVGPFFGPFRPIARPISSGSRSLRSPNVHLRDSS